MKTTIYGLVDPRHRNISSCSGNDVLEIYATMAQVELVAVFHGLIP